MLRVLALLPVAALSASGGPPLDGIAHIGLRVSDPARAHAYYSGVLGLRRAFTAADGAAFYKVSDDQYLEIAPGLKPDDVVRLTHIALATRDVASVRRLLRTPAPRADPNGDLSVSVTAPEGTRIDFVKYRPGGRETEARGQFLEGPSISRHLQHTGVIVLREQLEAVLKFYRDTLGCREVWRLEAKPGDLRLVKLLVPGARRDIIELMIRATPPDAKAAGSAHHINFEVADIHAAHRFVRARGAPVAPDFRPRVNAEDIWAFNLFDPDGTRTEVQDLTKIPAAAVTEETFHGRRAWVLSN